MRGKRRVRRCFFASHAHRRPGRQRVRLGLENLEPRLQLTAAWQNPLDPMDVNGDTRVSPQDALLVMNKLNREGPGQLPALADGAQPPVFYDANGNGRAESGDVLRVVNALNGGPMMGHLFVTPPAEGVRGQLLTFHFATEISGSAEYEIDCRVVGHLPCRAVPWTAGFSRRRRYLYRRLS